MVRLEPCTVVMSPATLPFFKITILKWFSKVSLRLKRRDLDLATRSLSIYKTRLPLFPIANASGGMQEQILCYMLGHVEH